MGHPKKFFSRVDTFLKQVRTRSEIVTALALKLTPHLMHSCTTRFAYLVIIAFFLYVNKLGFCAFHYYLNDKIKITIVQTNATTTVIKAYRNALNFAFAIAARL